MLNWEVAVQALEPDNADTYTHVAGFFD